jgi:prevent-host-death family protein
MDNPTVTLTQLKNELSEIVNRAAYGGQRIVILSRGKERAALIGLEDLRRLEALEADDVRKAAIQRGQKALDEARVLREKMTPGQEYVDSVEILEQVREERLDDVLGMR